jgi:hypothetical protein
MKKYNLVKGELKLQVFVTSALDEGGILNTTEPLDGRLCRILMNMFVKGKLPTSIPEIEPRPSSR